MPALEQFFSSFFNFVALPSTAYANHSLQEKSSDVKVSYTVRRERTMSLSGIHFMQRNSALVPELADPSRDTMGTGPASTQRNTFKTSRKCDLESQNASNIADRTRSRKDSNKANSKVKRWHSASVLPSATSSNGSQRPVTADRQAVHRRQESLQKADRSNLATTLKKATSFSAKLRTRKFSSKNAPPVLEEDQKVLDSAKRADPQPTLSLKDLKRKRSSSSANSITNLPFNQLTSKLYGFVLRSPKRARLAMSEPQSKPIQGQVLSCTAEENAYTDIHSALRSAGVRLVGTSVDFDDIYDDKPDDVIINPSSLFQLLNGEHPSSKSHPNAAKVKLETATYHLWASCWNACQLFPIESHELVASSEVPEDQNRKVVQEKRVYHAYQLLFVSYAQAILDYLSEHGRVHIPIDSRVSSDAADIVQRALSLVSLFKETDIDPSRVVFDVPATQAGIIAGYSLSLRHGILVNFTLVCDIKQTALCLKADPYGLSIPIKSIKSIDDRENLSWFDPFSRRNTFNIQDHPTFEMVQSIAHLAETYDPLVIVSARNVETRQEVSALRAVRSISPSPDLLKDLRWFSALQESHDREIYLPWSAENLRKAQLKAREILSLREKPASKPSAKPIGKVERDGWMKLPLVDTSASWYPPRVQRRYTDQSWIFSSESTRYSDARDSSSQLSCINFSPYSDRVLQPHKSYSAKQDDSQGRGKDRLYQSFDGRQGLAYPGQHMPSIHKARGKGDASSILMTDMLSLGEKKRLLQIMEPLLEQECVGMGKLHELVELYLTSKFISKAADDKGAI